MSERRGAVQHLAIVEDSLGLALDLGRNALPGGLVDVAHGDTVYIRIGARAGKLRYRECE
jgi:hypothetical protein